jgi:hypothetical protein
MYTLIIYWLYKNLNLIKGTECLCVSKGKQPFGVWTLGILYLRRISSPSAQGPRTRPMLICSFGFSTRRYIQYTALLEAQGFMNTHTQRIYISVCVCVHATIVMVPFVAISEQALNKDMVPDFSISSSALFSLWHNGNIQVAPYSAKDWCALIIHSSRRSLVRTGFVHVSRTWKLKLTLDNPHYGQWR